MLWQREASSYVGVARASATSTSAMANGTVEGIDERSLRPCGATIPWRVAS